MRGTHFFTSTVDPGHPLHYMQTPRTTRRHIHNTPAAHYTSLYNTLPPTPDGTSLRRHIHTTFTERALEALPPNSLLGTRPPPISSTENSLPRLDQVHLSRLRCGHHTAIPTYMHRIGLAPNDTCSLCGQSSGSMEHILLHCLTLHTHRATHNIHSLEQLWSHPREVLSFLRDSGILPPNPALTHTP